jgi:hypothetical protein
MCITLKNSSLVPSHCAPDAQSINQSVKQSINQSDGPSVLTSNPYLKFYEGTVKYFSFLTFPNFRKSFYFTKIPRFHSFLLLREYLKTKRSMEHWWKDTDNVKPQYWDRNIPLPLCPTQNQQGIDGARTKVTAVRS